LQNIKLPFTGGLMMDEETKDHGEVVAEDGGDSEGGRGTLEDLTEGRLHLVRLLDNPEVVCKNPGDWIFQEGDEIHRFAYIVMGRVNILAAGEVVGVVKSQELLGAAEFLLRDESPKYTKAAQAVEQTFLLWLDENGFQAVIDPKKGALMAYLRLQARIEKQLEGIVRAMKVERGKFEVTVAQLRTALGRTQDDLARIREHRFQSRPKLAPPPPPRKAGLGFEELQNRLRAERETNQNLVRLIERRDRELVGILGDLRQTIEENPALAKNEALTAFIKRLEAAVTRRENTVIALKPL